MAFNTRTYYVAQNQITLDHLRNPSIPRYMQFDDSSPKTVQEAWDAGIPMRSLGSNRHYIKKGDLGEVRVCFVNGDFFRFLSSPYHSQTGERLDGQAEY